MAKKLWRLKKILAGLFSIAEIRRREIFLKCVTVNFDFRYGRVNYVLAKRLELLNQVKKLQHSLDIPGTDMHTCETAGYFFLYRILSRWEKFLSIVKPANKQVRC